MNKQKIGQLGENLAVEYLKKRGYQIKERNFRTRLGEIDIIAKDGPVLCFIEVKTRTGTAYGLGEEAINRAKQRKISQIVVAYLNTRRIIQEEYRFDVIAIELKENEELAKISLIQDAFELDRAYFS